MRGEKGRAVARRLDLRHHEDVARPRIVHDADDVFPAVVAALLVVHSVAQVLPEGPAPGELGPGRNFEAPRLIVGQMPVKYVELVERGRVEQLFDECRLEEVSGAVEHEPAPREPRLVPHHRGADGRSLRKRELPETRRAARYPRSVRRANLYAPRRYLKLVGLARALAGIRQNAETDGGAAGSPVIQGEAGAGSRGLPGSAIPFWNGLFRFCGEPGPGFSGHPLRFPQARDRDLPYAVNRREPARQHFRFREEFGRRDDESLASEMKRPAPLLVGDRKRDEIAVPRHVLSSGAEARDPVAVIIEAELGPPLPVGGVDAREPELLRVAEGPLEIVQEAPHEVSFERHTVRKRLAAGLDVALQVRDAVIVADDPVRAWNIGKGRPVLGNIQGLAGPVPGDMLEDAAQALRLDLPVHLGLLLIGWHEFESVRVLAGRIRGPHGLLVVVVHADEIERRSDDVHVSRLGRQVLTESLRKARGIPPPEHRVEPQGRTLDGSELRRVDVLGAQSRRSRPVRVYDEPVFARESAPPIVPRRESVREKEVVYGARRRHAVPHARRVIAHQVPQKSRAPGLVHARPVAHAVSDMPVHDRGILLEAQRRVAAAPSAGLLEGLREVPVKELEPGLYASFGESVHKP